MFNIVKRRDFMLGQNVATEEEAEQAAREYGADYIAVKIKPLGVDALDDDKLNNDGV